MKSPRRLPVARRITVVNGVMLFVVLVVILQLWLLTATMNGYLGGDDTTALPAALASLICLGFNLGLLRYLHRLD